MSRDEGWSASRPEIHQIPHPGNLHCLPSLGRKGRFRKAPCPPLPIPQHVFLTKSESYISPRDRELHIPTNHFPLRQMRKMRNGRERPMSGRQGMAGYREPGAGAHLAAITARLPYKDMFSSRSAPAGVTGAMQSKKRPKSEIAWSNFKSIPKSLSVPFRPISLHRTRSSDSR